MEILKSVESTGLRHNTPDSIEYNNDVVSDCINLKTIRLPKHMEGKYFIDEFDFTKNELGNYILLKRRDM